MNTSDHTGLAGFYDTEGVDYDEHNPDHKAARNKAKAFVFGWIYGQGSVRRGNILSSGLAIEWHNTTTNKKGICQ